MHCAKAVYCDTHPAFQQQLTADICYNQCNALGITVEPHHGQYCIVNIRGQVRQNWGRLHADTSQSADAQRTGLCMCYTRNVSLVDLHS